MAQITLEGTPLEVGGKFLEKGDQAPEFTLTDSQMQERSLSEWDGKRKVLNIVPSLDTGVCAASARKFNEKAGSMDNTVVLVISADLPTAAGRFCSTEGLDNVTTLSIFRNDDFRRKYGVAIESGPIRGFCARSVVVLDENNRVLHSELVPEIAQEPDYDAALAVL